MPDAVYSLYLRLAGDKLAKTDETVKKLIKDGKSRNRALADALEIHRCPKFLTTQDN